MVIFRPYKGEEGSLKLRLGNCSKKQSRFVRR